MYIYMYIYVCIFKKDPVSDTCFSVYAVKYKSDKGEGCLNERGMNFELKQVLMIGSLCFLSLLFLSSLRCVAAPSCLSYCQLEASATPRICHAVSAGVQLKPRFELNDGTARF